MAEKYVSFRIGKETSLGSEVVPTENKNPFTDGTLIFAYNNKYNYDDTSKQIVDGRLYVDAAIDGNNYRFPINSECSYFLINEEDGKDFEMGNTGRPVYFSGGIPQPVDYISTSYGGTGLTSFTANRIVWTSSTSELSTSGHYVDVNHLAVNSETLPIYNFYVHGTSGFYEGHLYLTGANASSSIHNETQIVFGTPSNNHVAISSNTKALIINPNTAETVNQIILYLDAQSKFPSGITCGDNDTIGNINTNGDLIAAGGLSVEGTASLGSNLNVTGSTAMQGNITITNENPHIKFINTENSNQIYYIQGYQGKFAFGLTFASAVQIDASGNMTLPSGATITPREDNTGSIGTNDYEWNEGYFRSIKSGNTLRLTPASTMYIDSGSDSSIIFSPQGIEQARFNTSGQLTLKSGGANTATLIGPDSADGTFYFPNTGGTFVTHATRGIGVGGTAKPVYITTTGSATALSATVGSSITPTYLNSGTITACNMAASGDWWEALPVIDVDGVMGIGKYIDFHIRDTGITNYDYRLIATTSNLTGSGSLTATTYVNAATGFGVTQTTGAGSGISLYGTYTGTAPTYGLMFAKTATFGTLGGVTSDWATYFTMSDITTRGWIFRRGNTNVCSISGLGQIHSYIATTDNIYHKVGNNNGTVGIHASTNRGLYDFTRNDWIIYSKASDNTTRIPNTVYLDAGAVVGASYTIQRAGKSSSWYNGRDNAFICMTTCNNYSPTISVKTTNGSWEIGSYNDSSYYDQLIIGYVSDTNYSTPTDSQNNQVRFDSGGQCEASVWYSKYYSRTANYGTGDPGSSTPGNGVAGALYFKIIS